MKHQITKYVFLLGGLVGFVSTLIKESRYILELVTYSLYSGNLSYWVFAGIWALIFGGIMVGSYAIYLSEGKWGLIRLVLLLGVFIGVFFFLAFGNVGINIF
jgi:hypothetical protein